MYGTIDIRVGYWMHLHIYRKRRFETEGKEDYIILYCMCSHAHHWFSGKIQRCHRWALGSIPGWCIIILIHGCEYRTDTQRRHIDV